ncbi:MAG: DUF3226 domain-containing protein [Isosphaeraceae bacterium]
MAETLVRSRLHVEGTDDQHSVVHLLIHNGVNYHPEQFELSPPELPRLVQLKGIDLLIEGIETAVKTSTRRTVGFLLDADSPLIDRWRRVTQKLRNVGVHEIPERPPAEGFIGESTDFKTRVGVWLMPDNVQDGKLEDFLLTLVKEHDALIGHARSSTDEARNHGASFSEPDMIKAIIHAWLAWQKEPGLPYGTAIKARYFKHDSPTAGTFVKWFKSLYQLT